MEQQNELKIDDVTYIMTPANAMRSWSAIKNALKLVNTFDLGAMNFEQDRKKLGLSVLTHLLSCLGDPKIKDLEEIVLSHTSARCNDKVMRLSDNPDRHFNQYRHHLITVLIEGAIYQFGDFFKGGGELLKNTQLAKMIRTKE